MSLNTASYADLLVMLATKDAEIAELRARLAEQKEAVDQAVELVEYLEGHSKGAMAERVKVALSAKFAQERKQERDEARECVRRLWQALRVFRGSAYPVAAEINPRRHNWSEAYLDEALPDAIAALDATPDHLR